MTFTLETQLYVLILKILVIKQNVNNNMKHCGAGKMLHAAMGGGIFDS